MAEESFEEFEHKSNFCCEQVDIEYKIRKESPEEITKKNIRHQVFGRQCNY